MKIDSRSSLTEEKRQHSSTLVPYSYYECCLPEYYMNVPMHWHSEFELNYIVAGKGEFICGDEKFIANKGDILIIPPNMLHAAYPYQNSELIYDALVFNIAMLGTNSNDRCTTECIRPILNGTMTIQVCINSCMDSYSELRTTIDHIFSSAKSNKSQYDLLLKSELMRLFWQLESKDELIHRKDSELSYSEIIRPALEFMTENFRERITIEQLANLVYLSKSYFMGCFKNAVGVGAMEHLTQLRIKAACEILSDTKDTISDISFHCGYSNLSNFNRHFKKTVGCTPKEYRKQLQQH